MDNNFHIEEIIGRVFSGNITQEELSYLRQWLSESEGNRELYDSYLNCWITAKMPNDKIESQTDSAWLALNGRIVDHTRTSRFSIKYLSRIAAAFLIILCLGTIVGLLVKNNAPDQQLSYTVYHSPGDSILKVSLPDHSQVFLNRGSILRYPSDFNYQNRDVYLEGEGYFEVTGNASLPFTVHTSALQVKVLGTSFNINAYKEESEIITTLVTGKIDLLMDNMRSTVLYPGQQFIFRKDTEETELLTVDAGFYTSWINGYYKFEQVSFEQIAKKFEMMYHVEIIFKDNSLKNIPFTGTFLQDQSIETSLDLLKEIRYFQYAIEGNKIIISK
ncbi:MAG: FecR family protein [Bacteroidales bacterium]|jgi:ferric-dicitrate binding protein FerR (iron transport regulator)|nr:FecR family protein [Bacteroidales bacterium]